MANTTKATANTRKTKGRKPGRIENLRPWKPGQSGNPKGRPRDGESWTGIFKKIGDMTGMDLADYFAAYASQFRKVGKVTMKEAVAARVYLSLVFEPTSGLLNALLDRAEGKVTQPVSVDWRAEYEQHGISATAEFERIVDDVITRLPGGLEGRGGEGGGASARGSGDKPSPATSDAGGSPPGG